MGQIRTRSSDIKKRLAAKREERKRKKGESDHGPKEPSRGKSDQLARREESPDGIDITGWPTRADASRRSGISRSTLIRLQQTEDIECHQDETGAWRYNPDDLDAIAETRTSEAAQIMTETVATVVKVSQEQASTGLDHAKDMHELAIEGNDRAWERMEKVMSVITSENDSLRERVKTLEEERRQNLELIEKAYGKTFDRETVREKDKRLDDRIDWALTTVGAIVGPLIVSKLGLIGAKDTTPAGTIGALLKAKEEKKPDGETTVNGEITIERLEELNMNALLLIANIDEQRFKMLCLVATPEEVKALTEVRETIAKIRANKEKKADGESSTSQGS